MGISPTGTYPSHTPPPVQAMFQPILAPVTQQCAVKVTLLPALAPVAPALTTRTAATQTPTELVQVALVTRKQKTRSTCSPTP
ncbi:hypothetical protein llap_21934 [Limosa lapponica baueri]|uniref:Uncharacterized protein n=1 Tax=Limosa lapponica baueri TaxID=1758121 RepID=A0A2I0T1W3_LIMLA|nr:hypothetical protein llap_21934 [Limosa lapponica baueri]